MADRPIRVPSPQEVQEFDREDARRKADAATRDNAEIKRMEFVVEVIRLGILAGVAVAFAHVGQMELASAAMGGALALLRPRGAPGPGALTVGLACGAATSFALSSGILG